MANHETIDASTLTDTVAIRLTRRGRVVGWISGLALVAAAAWGVWLPDSAPALFTWPPLQLLIILSAAQTMLQLNIDQGKGLIRVGPDQTRVWRVGGLPRRYPSSRVTIEQGREKAQLLVDGRVVGRIDLFDIGGAFASSGDD